MEGSWAFYFYAIVVFMLALYLYSKPLGSCILEDINGPAIFYIDVLFSIMC